MGLDSIRFQPPSAMKKPSAAAATPSFGATSMAQPASKMPASPSMGSATGNAFASSNVRAPQSAGPATAPSAVQGVNFGSNFDSGMAKNLFAGLNPSAAAPSMKGGASVPIPGGQYGQAARRLDIHV